MINSIIVLNPSVSLSFSHVSTRLSIVKNIEKNECIIINFFQSKHQISRNITVTSNCMYLH